MSEQGERVEFGDRGPYLFQELAVEPQAMLLDEHDVCLFQFGGLYLPVAQAACRALADALSNMSPADMGPERTGMTPLDFDLDETTELPLLTGVAGESFQFGETVYLDVFFGDTAGRMCFAVQTAAMVAQVAAQVPEK